jgi:hypothetical protein
MPFGLRNAPASFQRLIDRFKTGLPDVILLAYLDDLIVFSPNPSKHLEDLRSVLAQMRKFQLRMNRAKCAFGCTEVKSLGHRITPNGIAVNPDKVLAVTQMPAPRNPKELQSFLQTCSWFRRFLERFATTSRPLSTLLKKDQSWTWGPAQQEAFQTLKKQLTSTLVLRILPSHLSYVPILAPTLLAQPYSRRRRPKSAPSSTLVVFSPKEKHWPLYGESINSEVTSKRPALSSSPTTSHYVG